MPIAVLPAYAKVIELRLAIPMPSDPMMRPADLDVPGSTPYREMWAGEIVIADMHKDNAKAFAAWAASLDGRVNPFRMTLTAGKFSRAYSGTSALAATPVLGADRIQLDLDATLKRGTRITVGDVETSTFQLFEVLQDVSPNPGAVVRVAPRVRVAFTGSETVVCGTVQAKLKLASDSIDVAISIARGVAGMTVEESLV